MFYLIVQTVLLFAVAFILGAVAGSLLRRWFAADDAPAPSGVDEAKSHRAVAVSPATPPAPPASPVAAAPEPEPVPVVPQPVPVPPPPQTVDRPEEVSAPPPSVAPAPAKQAAPAAVDDDGKRDNLKRIRGIGPQNEARLNAIGIVRFEQIAAWSKKDQREMGERLAFPGRIEREDWVRQAKRLAGEGGEAAPAPSPSRVRTAGGGTDAESDVGTPPALLAAPNEGGADRLTRIDGVGPALERKLAKLGVFHFSQIAAWSDGECAWIGREIGFPGRVAREGWVAQAATLAGTADDAGTDAASGTIRPRG